MGVTGYEVRQYAHVESIALSLSAMVEILAEIRDRLPPPQREDSDEELARRYQERRKSAP